jgi:hypothetical protein
MPQDQNPVDQEAKQPETKKKINNINDHRGGKQFTTS